MTLAKYQAQQARLAQEWDSYGGDHTCCYMRLCDVCRLPVYARHPVVKRHDGRCTRLVFYRKRWVKPSAKGCPVCRRPFTRRHRDARYCTDACRQRAYRGKGTERYGKRLKQR